MIPQPKFTDNGARRALWVSDKFHNYISKLAKKQKRTQASIVEEMIMILENHVPHSIPTTKERNKLDELERWMRAKSPIPHHSSAHKIGRQL